MKNMAESKIMPGLVSSLKDSGHCLKEAGMHTFVFQNILQVYGIGLQKDWVHRSSSTVSER